MCPFSHRIKAGLWQSCDQSELVQHDAGQALSEQDNQEIMAGCSDAYYSAVSSSFEAFADSACATQHMFCFCLCNMPCGICCRNIHMNACTHCWGCTVALVTVRDTSGIFCIIVCTVPIVTLCGVRCISVATPSGDHGWQPWGLSRISCPVRTTWLCKHRLYVPQWLVDTEYVPVCIF